MKTKNSIFELQMLQVTMHLNHLNKARSQEEFDLMVSNLTCAQCADFQTQVCEGELITGEKVLFCVMGKAENCEYDFHAID